MTENTSDPEQPENETVAPATPPLTKPADPVTATSDEETTVTATVVDLGEEIATPAGERVESGPPTAPAPIPSAAWSPVASTVTGEEPGAAESAAVATAEPVSAEPVSAEAVSAEPVIAEPVIAEPVIAEPVAAEPILAEPVSAEPVTAADPAPVVPLVDPAPPVAPEAPVRHEGVVPDPAPQPDRSLAGQVRAGTFAAEAPPVDTFAGPAVAPIYAPDAVVAEAPIDPAPVAPVIVPAEPQPVPITAPAVYVEAPEKPRVSGNRFAGILIGILATIVFAAAFFGANYGVRALLNEPTEPLPLISAAWFWGATAFFFLGTVLVAAIVNRGPWWTHVLGGIFVGLFAAAGTVGGLLLADAYTIFPEDLGSALLERTFSVPTLLAFILGREVPVWFGLWVAARGRRITARNHAELTEYERLLDAGPQLAR